MVAGARRRAAALGMALVVASALVAALADGARARPLEGDRVEPVHATPVSGPDAGPGPDAASRPDAVPGRGLATGSDVASATGPDASAATGSAPADAGTAISDVDRRIWYEAQIAWRDGRALGLPWNGSLVDGVQLPVEGQSFFTWDPVHMRPGNPDDRRWGTDELILTILGVLDAYRAANPDAPRVGVEDLSRPHGGEFGVLYGGLGHRSHQNGLDVDITYPRRDRQETGIWHPDEVDLELAQDLVDRFVDAGAEQVFVGPSLDLTGPPDVVQALRHHDDHLHVRIPPRG